MQKYPEVLYCILDHLSKIWTRSEWKTNLIDSFCDCQFRTTFLNVVVFFEKELEVCIMGSSSETDQEGSRSYATLTTLLQLILPPLLVMLQSMQSLWTKAVASNIPDVLEDAKYMVFSEETGETVEVLNIDKEEQEENAIRDWLETTRQSGYNVIGMCAQLEGMFDGVLDSSTDLECEGKYNESTEEVFQSWLINQMVAVRCRNTPFHELEEFVWTWEIEEEFRDYIPAYIDMLHEVDKMDDCVECRYSNRDIFEKLKPEFVSRYAIDSASHDYIWTMSSMLSRKISAKHWQTQNDEMCKFFCELIDFKPYIQHSSYDESVMELVENSEVYPDLDSFCRASALKQLCAMLSWLEPQFHPLIREGHKDVLVEIVRDSFYLYNITYLQPLQPNLGDVPAHLRPCARNYIDEKNKMYHMAKEQARLHEEFDAHVSTGALDHFICKGDAPNAILDDDIIHSRFLVLDHTLIKLSFERRAKLLGRRDQLCSYYQHLRQVVHNEQLRIGLQSLMCELEAEGFLSIADDSIDWDKKCFSQLVDKFDKQVFVGVDLPKYYVIRGIMDYRAMSLMKDDFCSWDQVFEKVVDKPYRRWIQNIPDLFWMETRYYKHQFHDIIHQPLQQFLPTP